MPLSLPEALGNSVKECAGQSGNSALGGQGVTVPFTSPVGGAPVVSPSSPYSLVCLGPGREGHCLYPCLCFHGNRRAGVCGDLGGLGFSCAGLVEGRQGSQAMPVLALTPGMKGSVASGQAVLSARVQSCAFCKGQNPCFLYSNHTAVVLYKGCVVSRRPPRAEGK